jgi:GGDEF domain-containing protein
VGIALACDAGSNPEELLKNADLALYAAKKDGRSCWRLFKPGTKAATKAA